MCISTRCAEVGLLIGFLVEWDLIFNFLELSRGRLCTLSRFGWTSARLHQKVPRDVSSFLPTRQYDMKHMQQERDRFIKDKHYLLKPTDQYVFVTRIHEFVKHKRIFRMHYKTRSVAIDH